MLTGPMNSNYGRIFLYYTALILVPVAFLCINNYRLVFT